MGLLGVRIRLVPNRSSLPLSDSRQLYRVSIGCLVHAAASVHHTYVGEDRRILASPCTGLSTDAPLFPLPFVGTPFVLAGFDVVSRVTLPAWPGQGYGRHWLFFRALSPICILSVAGRSIIFKVIWIFVYYICILDSLSRCCVYMFCGSHRGLLCNVITSFSTRTKVPGGHLRIVSMRVWRVSLKLA